MSTPRLAELDALRGLAAMSVVLFHYTTRITQLYGEPFTPTLTFPRGDLGVHLFFIISGFVIFMTLDHTRSAADFVVGRFSRLFPTYWAAIALTFCLTAALGLPGRSVSALQALANAPMLHGLLGIPHVDGVYWTLEVELLFYLLMLGGFAATRRSRSGVSGLCLVLLAVQWRTAHGLDLPPLLQRLLILDQLAWFTLGIGVYLCTHPVGSANRLQASGLTAGGLLTLWAAGGASRAALAAGLATLVWAAVSGRLKWLSSSVLVWLGAVSYPLYLVHQNVGYSLLLLAGRWHLDRDLSVLVTVALCLALAAVLSRAVERPAMAAIRRRRRQHQDA